MRALVLDMLQCNHVLGMLQFDHSQRQDGSKQLGYVVDESHLTAALLQQLPETVVRSKEYCIQAFKADASGVEIDLAASSRWQDAVAGEGVSRLRMLCICTDAAITQL